MTNRGSTVPLPERPAGTLLPLPSLVDHTLTHAPRVKHRTPFQGTIAYMGGVPALHAEWVWSWTNLIAYNAEVFGPGRIHYDRATVSYHAEARNQLASRFKGDWLLQLDTDHQFDPSVAWRLVSLMERRNLDVLSGFYQTRFHPHHPVIYRHRSEPYPDGQPNARPVIGWSDTYPVIEIHAAGGGCLLVRRGVFDRIRQELGEEPFDIRHPWSEDHSFFLRCKQLGIKAHCDTRVQYNHLTTRVITREDFNESALMGNREESEFEAIE